MKLTIDRIFECRTANGGWTRATIEAFGMRWSDLHSGWPRRVAGREISDDDWKRALDGKSVFKPRKDGLPRKERAPLCAHPDAGKPVPGGW